MAPADELSVTGAADEHGDGGHVAEGLVDSDTDREDGAGGDAREGPAAENGAKEAEAAAGDQERAEASAGSEGESADGGTPELKNMTSSQRRRFRTVVCRFWKQGRCKFGDTCRFLHDEEGEIATAGDKKIREIQDHFHGALGYRDAKTILASGNFNVTEAIKLIYNGTLTVPSLHALGSQASPGASVGSEDTDLGGTPPPVGPVYFDPPAHYYYGAYQAPPYMIDYQQQMWPGPPPGAAYYDANDAAGQYEPAMAQEAQEMAPEAEASA